MAYGWRRRVGLKARDRQARVRERIAAAGLDQRDSCFTAQSTGKRLRCAAEDLGPVFVCFSRYLATRIDIMPLSDCLELARARDPNGATPAAGPDSIIRAELGNRTLPTIAEQPFRRNLLYQWHRGTLDNTPVTVKIVRPELEPRLATDLGLLRLLAEAAGCRVYDLMPAIEDFTTPLDRQLDLNNEAAGLAELAAEVTGFDALTVPRLHSDLCSRRVLVSEITGDPIDRGDDDDPARANLARLVVAAWLQQSLLESWCPEGPLGDNLMVLADDRFAVTGGLFVQLTRKTRRNLFNYLAAVARQEPDRACSSLLSGCEPSSKATSRDQLRMRFRQAEPFREGGWSDHFAGQRLADTLFVQWRLARQSGWRTSPSQLAFFRGLWDLELLTRRLAPASDALSQGLADLRVVAAATHLREGLGPSRLRGTVEQLLPVIQEVATWVCDLESADGVLASQQPAPSRDGQNCSGGNSWPVVIAMLCLLAALVLLVDRLSLIQLTRVWVERVGATLFALISVWLLTFVLGRRVREK